MGPPPEQATAAVVVGLPREQLERWFGSVQVAGRIDNGVRPDNEERGTTVWLATERQVPWSRIWPELRRLA